jgi:hypothetical protein
MLPDPPNWVRLYNWALGPAVRSVEIGFVCTMVFQPTTDYRLPPFGFVCTARSGHPNAASGRSQTVSEPRMARSKA